MNEKAITDKKDKILMNIYGSSLGISMTALTVVAILEVFMLIYSVINISLFGPYIWEYRSFYIFLLSLALVYMWLNTYVKKDLARRFRLLNYANPLCAVLFFIWSLGITYSDLLKTGICDPTVFMTFSLVVPLSFFLFPSVYAVIVIAANALMISMSVAAGSGLGPLINLSIFFIFQFVLGISFLRLKIRLAQRIVEEEANADIDVMTGFMNRRVYEEDLKSIEAGSVPEDLVYIAIDINGLKEVNDKYGHDAGDRMIVGAAECIEKCFGSRGKLYRIGGDEYAAILTTRQEDLGALFAAYEECMRAWSESSGMSLSTSWGCVSAVDYPGKSITDLARTADAKMYAAKARFYQTCGQDRRRYIPQPEAAES